MAEPETRVGHCCGCQTGPIALFKIPGIYRYRCATCFKRETGYRHHSAPDLRVSYRVKLEGKRITYADVLAMNPDDAVRIALQTNTGACGQCLGRTADLVASTYHGPSPYSVRS